MLIVPFAHYITSFDRGTEENGDPQIFASFHAQNEEPGCTAPAPRKLLHCPASGLSHLAGHGALLSVPAPLLTLGALLLSTLLLTGLLGHLIHSVGGFLLLNVVSSRTHLLNDLVQLAGGAGEQLFRLRIIGIEGKALQVARSRLQLTDGLMQLSTGSQVAHLLLTYTAHRRYAVCWQNNQRRHEGISGNMQKGGTGNPSFPLNTI